jgi:hypothetical protein
MDMTNIVKRCCFLQLWPRSTVDRWHVGQLGLIFLRLYTVLSIARFSQTCLLITQWRFSSHCSWSSRRIRIVPVDTSHVARVAHWSLVQRMDSSSSTLLCVFVAIASWVAMRTRARPFTASLLSKCCIDDMPLEVHGHLFCKLKVAIFVGLGLAGGTFSNMKQRRQ